MNLFLCSHFSSVGSLIKEEIENKKVAFIPTASLREGYTGYVGSARKLFKKLGAIVTEICTTGMCTAHAEPTHSGLLRNKSALTTIAGAEPTMRKTQV